MAAPAEPANGGKKRKSSKFGFKNGLKSLKSKVKKNDKSQSSQDNSSSDLSKVPQNGKSSKSTKRKNSKIKAPVMPKLDLATYTFPPQILPPSESWGMQSYDEDEKKIHNYLTTKYKKEISECKFFPSDIVIRFTLSQRGMTPFQSRQNETELHFRAYLKYHSDYHSDTILSDPQLNTPKAVSSEEEMKKMFPLFIYGQDMEGHPIFWDDGRAFGKDADFQIFKEDLQRVRLYRTRLMKRMHNVKMAASKKYGRIIYKHCLVMDLSSFNAKKFVKERKFHEECTKEISDLYPESLHRLYVINTPSAFRVAWKVIQTFLDPITAEKTKILGKDFIAEMMHDINLDMIPHRFGGIGPWDIRYGDTPEHYEFESGDIDFDYSSLPPNELPMPPRAAPPDMNKHKARREKAMKESGLRDLEMLAIDDEEEQNEDRKDAEEPDDEVPEIQTPPDAASVTEQKDDQ